MGLKFMLAMFYLMGTLLSALLITATVSWMVSSGLMSTSALTIISFSFDKFEFISSYTVCVVLFVSTVLIVASSVLFYSNSYMDSDLSLLRFLILLVLFIFSMIILILSSSWSSLILGWDGLGLSSYFLVVFYLNYSSNSGGSITVISNRIGDVFIILFILSMIESISSSTPSFFWVFGSGMILLAAITKSAMFPYMSWLPEAMAAPTPVSSLVHSSTLVTAGVYLLLQFNWWMLWKTWYVLVLLAMASLMSSSLVALSSQDLKKVVALSTLSQLSLMMTSLSLGFFMLSFFHLIGHAMFKSCLFLSVGAIIHLSGMSQEARLIHGSKYMTTSVMVMSISLMCLMGVPFSSAYFSKETILMSSTSTSSSLILIFLLIMSALFTMLYSARMIISVMVSLKFTAYNVIDTFYLHVYTMVLLIMSVSLGHILSPLMVIPYDFSVLVLGVIIMLFTMVLSAVTTKYHAKLKLSNFINMMNLKSITMFYVTKMMFSSTIFNTQWEMGAMSSFVSRSWIMSSKIISSNVLYLSQLLFSKYLASMLALILMLMMIY